MADLPYNHTGYDDASYFRSEAIAKINRRKCRLRRLGEEFMGNGFIHDHVIVNTRTNVDYMTSPTASARLQNAIEYCIKVRKVSPAAKESKNSAIV